MKYVRPLRRFVIKWQGDHRKGVVAVSFASTQSISSDRNEPGKPADGQEQQVFGVGRKEINGRVAV